MLKIFVCFYEKKFLKILSCSISQMYDLDYIILKNFNTHFYKLSENISGYLHISHLPGYF